MKWMIVLDLVYVVFCMTYQTDTFWLSGFLMILNIYMLISCSHNHPWRLKYVPGLLLILALTAFGFAVITILDAEEEMVCLAKQVHHLEQRIRYGKAARIEAIEPGHFPAEEIRIKVETQEDIRVYLKCFCGTIYEDEKWREAYPWEETFAGIERELAREGFGRDVQVTNFLREQGILAGREIRTIQVENLSASRKYSYQPYYSEQSAEENCYHVYDANAQMALSEFLLQCEITEYSKEEMLCRSLVYATCLSLPEAFEEKMKGYSLESIGGENAYDVIKSVENAVNGEADGFRRAEDAALLLRYAGMPARYVEGYLADAAKGNDDSENRIIHVTDADLTAWVEVYLDGIGFVPIWFENLSEGISEVEVSSEMPETMPDISDADTVTGSQKESGASQGAVYVWALLLVGSASLTAVLLYYRKCKERRNLKDEEFDFALNSTNFSVYLCRALENVVEYHGVHIDMECPYAAVPEIESKLGQEMRMRFERILSVSDELRFGKTGKESVE